MQSTAMINNYASVQTERAKRSKKQTAIWISIILIAFILFYIFTSIITHISLNSAKNTEEYQLAYSYLTESKTFDTLGISADEIKFNSYSRTDKSEAGVSDAEISFRIGFMKKITVYLHDDGNGWYVCKECTAFD